MVARHRDMPVSRFPLNPDTDVRPLWWVCEAYLHQTYKPCVIGAIPSQTYGRVWWWDCPNTEPCVSDRLIQMHIAMKQHCMRGS